MIDYIEHNIKLSKENAMWHRVKYLETKDRYHLGQWKAYSRVSKCLRKIEVYDKNGQIFK